MSSPKRLELLDLICQGEKTVETLSRETGLTVANTSQRHTYNQGNHSVRNGRITLLAVLAVAVTVGALWLTNGAVAPKEAIWDDVVAEAKNGGYQLISTDDLWGHYSENRDSLLLVDTRQEWEYRTGHIQEAVNFPMEPTWLARWQKKGDLGRFLGADKDRTIIFY